MPEPLIRPANESDIRQILRFVRELADYERGLSEVTATEEDLNYALFGPAAKAHALICERDGESVGFAVYFFNFSTWLGKYGLFLEDLYVTPAARGQGLGKMLLQYLARLAVAQGCGRFEWNVLDWNEPAIRFYESCGAEPQSEWVGYRLSGAALRRFSEE